LSKFLTSVERNPVTWELNDGGGVVSTGIGRIPGIPPIPRIAPICFMLGAQEVTISAATSAKTVIKRFMVILLGLVKSDGQSCYRKGEAFNACEFLLLL